MTVKCESVLFAMMALGSATELPKSETFYRVNTARGSGDDSGTGLGYIEMDGRKSAEEQ